MPARYGVRYLIAGGVNTIVTYIVYLLLLTPVGYRIAYFLAFILGIGLSFVLDAAVPVLKVLEHFLSASRVPGIKRLQCLCRKVIKLVVTHLF